MIAVIEDNKYIKYIGKIPITVTITAIIPITAVIMGPRPRVVGETLDTKLEFWYRAAEADPTRE